ncbi:hypothetical protein K5X82_01800 [Halosquirtibacter xylanolyticus]|uniref:DUF302 domain-containing protein n=1 Tax=Halosquirtibacter xylanolyticus TaxID=3374599 RepID=UPI0037481F42|nr:hypothetical protein K5X82_01800 [Prolixibacteraceae bacterium]
MIKPFYFIVLSIFLWSCNDPVINEAQTIEAKVDNAHFLVEKNSIQYREIVQLDHHRMAKKCGIYTPPAIVNIFTDDSPIVSKLLTINQEVAMDMPFKILAYSEADTVKASIRYTSAKFLQKRHRLKDADLKNYNDIIEKIISNLPEELIVIPNIDNLTRGYGIIKIESKYNFQETMTRIQTVLNLPQNIDTRIFTQIDFQKDAKAFGIDIRPTFLWLFGATKPGGMAMHDAPQIGLDAFCQKLLVYVDVNNNVQVCFSDMAAFSKLYYRHHNKAQQVVTKRMASAFKKVLTN